MGTSVDHVEPQITNRLAARLRPDGTPLMYQSWGSLLFMHWRVEPETLRPLLPERLSVDTFHGSAWIALTPFTLWNVRPAFVFPLPWVSNFHEINVRTYVHLNGAPGIWFFSLDANSLLPVLAARTLYHLPYYDSDIEFDPEATDLDFRLKRSSGEAPAHFSAKWSVGKALPEAMPGSLEFFLAERYTLYTEHKGDLYRARIHHQPWPLFSAELSSYESNLFEANSLAVPADAPMVHGGGPVKVEVWPIEKV